MGTITAHAEISIHVIQQLAKVRPDEEYVYLELGNYLTDVSQFRDPYSYLHARKTVLLEATRAALPIPIVGLPTVAGVAGPWLDEMLGKPDPAHRHGALAQFFTSIIHGLTHFFIANDSRYQAFLLGPLNTLGISLQFPSPSELDRVFAKFYTQYYPHEHLDFPPYHDPEREGPNYRTSEYRRQSSGLIGYLEDQQQSISEELSKIELAWVKSRTQASSHPDRHDLLIRLGHALHAVEDYFFHSNFAEIYQWERILGRNPVRQVRNKSDHDWLLLHGLDGTRYDSNSALLLKRRLSRRLRYPIFDPKVGAMFQYEPSRTASEEATDLVYTGGFGSNDVYHTIHDGLLSLQELFSGQDVGKKLTNSDLVLVRVLFNEEVRQRMVKDEEYAASLVKQHRDQTNQGVYIRKIKEGQDKGDFTSSCARELQSAFELDKTIENKYKGRLPGPGGFLIKFLAAAQRESMKSHARVATMNGNEQSIFDESTFNGASAETIGTHSLLSKDAKEKQPLRDYVMALAKHASTSLALLMAQRVNQDQNPAHGLDWLSIVRYFMRFPNRSPQSWEAQIITSIDENSNLPAPSDVLDRPNFRILGPDSRFDELQARRNGTTTSMLEKRYQQLESRAGG